MNKFTAVLKFPTLQSGAIAQYPISRTTSFSTEILQFMDGSKQRYRLRSQTLRRWVIHLNLLTDLEMSNLVHFVDKAQGSFGHFSFTDPWENKEVPDCSFEDDAFILYWNTTNRGNGTLNIRENQLSAT